MKAQLSGAEFNGLPGILMEERQLLQRFFKASSSKHRADVPNMHMAVHYTSNIKDYGTPHNVSVNMGEQKHKMSKMHAPHTNSRGTELQLMDYINQHQTFRQVSLINELGDAKGLTRESTGS